MKINLTNLFSALFLSLLFTFSVNAQTNNNSDKNENTNKTSQADRPLKITSHPHPGLPSKCLEDNQFSFLQIRLKATFHSSGKITEVEIVKSSGCEAFDKECLRVAKKIKFKPAIKNGELVTLTKTLEYSASIR